MAAALLTRLIGVFQRVPLYRMIRAEGIGLYTASYDYYAIALGLASSGINVAIAKQVAERMALGDAAGAKRVFRLSAAFYWGAPFLASRGFGNTDAYLSFVAVAPAIFLVSLMAPYRGWFQGQQVMGPVGTSLVVEQLGRVVVMLVLAYTLLPRGLPWAAAGAAAGAFAGAVTGLIYLIYAYRQNQAGWDRRAARAGPSAEGPPGKPGRGQRARLVSAGRILRQTLRLAIPVSVASLMFQLFMLVDTNMVLHRLAAAGLALDQATEAFGRLKGPATSVVNLPTVLTFAIANSLVPVISEAMILGRRDTVQKHSAAAVRMTLLLTIPALVGLYLLAAPIQLLIFADAEAGGVTQALSAAVIFVPLQMTSSAILQGLGKVMAPVWNLAAGAAVKLVLTWVLTADPHLGVGGAAYATAAGFFVAAGLNLSLAERLVGSLFNGVDMILKPCLAATAMGLAVLAGYGWLYETTGSNGAATLGAISLGFLVYALGLLLLGGVQRDDVQYLPGGPVMLRYLPFIRS